MATLKAKYLYDSMKWAEVGDNVIVSENGDVSTKKFVVESNDYADFSVIVDTLDKPEAIEVDDSVYEYAEGLAELIQSVVDEYNENPPKTFEEDLNYEFNDDDPNEWTQYYEDADQSETNPS
jgi:hypothetical protein